MVELIEEPENYATHYGYKVAYHENNRLLGAADTQSFQNCGDIQNCKLVHM